MKVCILGLGYIGIPTAATIANSGINVIGVDPNTKIVDAINAGKLPIEEPGLAELLKSVCDRGLLKASAEVEPADVFIIAVPTPMNEEKKPVLDYVKAATSSVASVLKKGDIVVLESTSPPRTTADLMRPILESGGFTAGTDFYLAHSPERVIPGRMVEELISNDRVIGGINAVSAEKTAEFYKKFVQGEIHTTDATTAEMCKLLENSFRGVNIAIANEIAILSEKVGVNAWEVINLANKHPRVNILQPGPGVGGHCIAIDPWFVVSADEQSAPLIKAAMLLNESMPYRQFKRIKEILGGFAIGGGNSDRKKIAFLGAAFKPNTDDFRHSPVIEIIELLSDISGAEIAVFDPHIDSEAAIKGLVDSPEDAFKDADLVCLAVHHDEFYKLDYHRLFGLCRNKRLFDMRNALPNLQAEITGLDYYLLGR